MSAMMSSIGDATEACLIAPDAKPGQYQSGGAASVTADTKAFTTRDGF